MNRPIERLGFAMVYVRVLVWPKWVRFGITQLLDLFFSTVDGLYPILQWSFRPGQCGQVDNILRDLV